MLPPERIEVRRCTPSSVGEAARACGPRMVFLRAGGAAGAEVALVGGAWPVPFVLVEETGAGAGAVFFRADFFGTGCDSAVVGLWLFSISAFFSLLSLDQ